MKFMKSRRNLILAKYIFITAFFVAIALQLSNLYFMEITSRLISEFILWAIGAGCAIFGGIAYHIEQKVRLRKYLTIIVVVLFVSLLTLFSDRDLLVVVGLGGGVIGFLDIKNTIDTGPE